MLPSKRPAIPAGDANLEFVQNDLKVALMFVEISSAAYSTGDLQLGGDARSKAEAAHARAVAQLVESNPGTLADDALQTMLKQVQSALSSLPSATHAALWTRRAAS